MEDIKLLLNISIFPCTSQIDYVFIKNKKILSINNEKNSFNWKQFQTYDSLHTYLKANEDAS